MRHNGRGVSLALVLAVVSLALVAEASWFSDYVRRPVDAFFAKAVNFKDRLAGGGSSPERAYRSGRSAGGAQSSWLSSSSSGGNNVAAGRSSNPDGEPTVRRTIDTPNDEYNAKCFLSRGPSLKDDPVVHFYSSETHSSDTLGCKVQLKIQLKTVNIDADKDPELHVDEQMIKSELIDSKRYVGTRPTFFLIHGFLSSWNGDNWMCNLKDLILNHTEANVFIVDWSGGAKPMLPLDYGAAVGNTKYVGQLLAAFVNELTRQSGQADASRFHLIGHSLGSHISGFVGYSVENLGRITGLDPAGPCFSTKSAAAELSASNDGYLPDNRRRLSPLSAQFVLALHTDTALFGLNENCADYDVYVNGGYKQPKCGSISLSSRVNDLLDFNFEDSLNPNIACAHSYAHDTVDTFAGLMGRGAGGKLLRRLGIDIPREQTGGLIGVEDGKCYPVAYQCDSWTMFKSGECGFCYNNDSRCVYTGLSLGHLQPRKLTDPSVPARRPKTPGSEALEDDDKFNDEDEELNDVTEDSTKDPGDQLVPSDRNSQGQHFIKLGAGSMTCVYHYQIIVAARKSQLAQVSNALRYFYYLHIPLEQSGLFNGPNGERLNDRLIQVSHKIEPNSPRHNFIVKRYLPLINNRKNLNGRQLRTEDVELYSALVTFHQAPPQQCQNGDSDGQTKSDKWQLCRPLDGLQEAQLWSSSDVKLNAVQWVSINYMSGLDLTQRVKNSYVLDRDLTEPVKSRAEVSENDRATVEGMAPRRSRSAASVARNAVRKPIDCFLSLLDKSDGNEAATNFKCGRSSRELKYAIKLKPIKL